MTKRTASRHAVKKSRFGIGLMIYTWVLLILGGVGLFFLQNYLTAYEASQPKYRLEEYRSALEETLPQAAREALGELDPDVQSAEATEAWAMELLRGAQLVKDPVNSTEERPLYLIRTAEGQPLGTVAFGVTDRGNFRLPVWGPVEEHFDFSPYYSSTEITVPSDYAVYVGDRLLGPENIVERDIPYEALEECYQHYENLPTMVRYESVPFVGDPSLRICDPDGKELTADQLNEDFYLDRCPRKVRDRVEEFVPTFIDLYILFSSDIDNSAYYYYDQIKTMVVREPESQLLRRMRQAFEGFGYSATRAATLQSTTVNRVTDLGEDRYLVDVSYETEVTGQEGPVLVKDRVLLVLIDFDGTLLADALYYS